MKTKLVAAAIALASFAAAPAGAANKYEAESAIDAAKAAQKEARAVRGEWRDTGKIIKQAEKALQKGDFDKTVKLAEKAEFQGKVGKKQALSQADAGPWH